MFFKGMSCLKKNLGGAVHHVGFGGGGLGEGKVFLEVSARWYVCP